MFNLQLLAVPNRLTKIYCLSKDRLGTDRLASDHRVGIAKNRKNKTVIKEKRNILYCKLTTWVKMSFPFSFSSYWAQTVTTKIANVRENSLEWAGSLKLIGILVRISNPVQELYQLLMRSFVRRRWKCFFSQLVRCLIWSKTIRTRTIHTRTHRRPSKY